jgi:hypothetical protein
MWSHHTHHDDDVTEKSCVFLQTGGGCVRPSHSNISRKISKKFTCFFADFLLTVGVCEIEFCRNQISRKWCYYSNHSYNGGSWKYSYYHQFIVESRCMVILSSSIIAVGLWIDLTILRRVHYPNSKQLLGWSKEIDDWQILFGNCKPSYFTLKLQVRLPYPQVDHPAVPTAAPSAGPTASPTAAPTDQHLRSVCCYFRHNLLSSRH